MIINLRKANFKDISFVYDLKLSKEVRKTSIDKKKLISSVIKYGSKKN